jgi:Ni,Fe-hydrogenase III small subunit
MIRWVIKGLQTGIVTTPYPEKQDNTLGITPGLPKGLGGRDFPEDLRLRCPTGALVKTENGIDVEYERCIHCYRCARDIKEPVPWKADFEWARMKDGSDVFPKAFRSSVHIRVLDAGDCGACINELKLLNNPFYNMHRLGFFITPTPRKADLLIVVGPVTEHMKLPLLKAYEAMPAPKRVMAVGACALCGGVFGPDFVTYAGVSEILPVDAEVPGCPPPPLAILHGLLTVTGRNTVFSDVHTPAAPEQM